MAKLRNFLNRRLDHSHSFFACFTFLIFFFVFSSNVFSQSQTILRGVVVEEKSQQALIGASISVKGTFKGSVSDANGEFQLVTEKKLPITLVVSSIGYRTQEIDVYENEALKISLSEDINKLSAVVVVGYGTTKREELTGAIASVQVSQLKDAAPTSFVDGLQGQASGVQVTSSSGAPGATSIVRIRGGNSITGGNDPLYVIDGFPVYNSNSSVDAGALYGGTSVTVGTTNGTNPLASFNPNDIESIEILKDASATAIYGSRGANGVIIITTKKGKAGKTTVTYDGSFGTQSVTKKIDLLSAKDYAIYRSDAGLNTYTQEQLDYYANNSTDWQNAAFRTAPIQNHQLAINGGTDKTKYSASISSLDQNGVVINTDFKRYTGRISLESRLSDNFNVGINFNQSYTTSNSASRSTISNILNTPSTVSLDTPVTPYEVVITNPIVYLNNTINRSIVQRTLATGFGEYEIIKGLKAKVLIGTDLLTNRQYSYIPLSITKYQSTDTKGSAATGTKFTTNWLNENTLTYTKSFNDIHNIDLLGGFTQQQSETQGNLTSGSGFTNDVTTYNDLSSATSKTISTSFTKWSLESFLARINYNYNHKYFITGSLRADGSSRLGANNRWGYFPSGSVAWQADKEVFFRGISDITKLNSLKIRLSIGRTGNQEIDPYQSLGLLRSVSYSDGSTVIGGYETSQIANPDLKWETTDQYDGGLDIAFFKDRIKFTADFYYKRTHDLLLNNYVPYTSGYALALQNIGEIENKGVDLSLSTENVYTKLFSWTSNLTFSLNRNKVISLGDGVNQILIGGGSDVGSLIKVGHSLGTFYGYKTDGLYTKENLPTDLSTTLLGSTTQAGDVKYVDTTGEGKITSDDQAVIGNAQPKFIFGFTNTFNISNFDLSVFLQGSYGNQIYSEVLQNLQNANGFENAIAGFADHYTATNTIAKYQRPNTKILAISNSDLYVYDGSYIRIKTITFGYTLPKIIDKKLKISNVRLYVAGTNLFTFTKYPGYDPDVNSYSENASRQGVDLGAYPSSKTILAGINITF